jgi:hypothetical protein
VYTPGVQNVRNFSQGFRASLLGGMDDRQHISFIPRTWRSRSMASEFQGRRLVEAVVVVTGISLFQIQTSLFVHIKFRSVSRRAILLRGTRASIFSRRRRSSLASTP